MHAARRESPESNVRRQRKGLPSEVSIIALVTQNKTHAGMVVKKQVVNAGS